ncbi:MAG: hypothetical protein FD124_3604 [Alphaproteobacteria bacterium]|nr:MAG: hypothetical protein FD124_3604 [Alphaproteobacteria bacterium]
MDQRRRPRSSPDYLAFTPPEIAAQHLFGRGDGRVRGCGAHFGGRLGFRAGDAFLGLLLAARNVGRHLHAGLFGDALGLFLGGRDDVGGLGFGGRLLLLVLGLQRFRFRTQAFRVGEFLRDRGGLSVQRVGDHLRHLQPDEQGEEDDEGEEGDEGRVELEAHAFDPPSFATMSRARSSAMAPTPESACVR